MQGMKFVACSIENNSIQRIFRLTDRKSKGCQIRFKAMGSMENSCDSRGFRMVTVSVVS